MQNPVYYCVPCSLPFYDQTTFVAHRAGVLHNDYTDSIGYYCLSCEPAKHFRGQLSWLEHRDTIHGIINLEHGPGGLSEQDDIRSAIELWPCPYCPVYAKRFRDLHLHTAHLSKAHSTDRILTYGNGKGQSSQLVMCKICDDGALLSIEEAALHIEVHRTNFVGSEAPDRQPVERTSSAVDAAIDLGQPHISAAAGSSNHPEETVAPPFSSTSGQTLHSLQSVSDDPGNIPSTLSSGTFGLSQSSTVHESEKVEDIPRLVDASAQSAELPQVAGNSSPASTPLTSAEWMKTEEELKRLVALFEKEDREQASAKP